MHAQNEIELRILVFLSEADFDYATRTVCRRRYWSREIRRQGAGLGIRILKNGDVELWAADEIHGVARLTLIHQGGSYKNMEKALGILERDAAFFLSAFCSNRWYELMDYLEECREQGMEDWKSGCGLYHEYLRLIREARKD